MLFRTGNFDFYLSIVTVKTRCMDFLVKIVLFDPFPLNIRINELNYVVCPKNSHVTVNNTPKHGVFYKNNIRIENWAEKRVHKKIN